MRTIVLVALACALLALPGALAAAAPDETPVEAATGGTCWGVWVQTAVGAVCVGVYDPNR